MSKVTSSSKKLFGVMQMVMVMLLLWVNMLLLQRGFNNT